MEGKTTSYNQINTVKWDIWWCSCTVQLAAVNMCQYTSKNMKAEEKHSESCATGPILVAETHFAVSNDMVQELILLCQILLFYFWARPNGPLLLDSTPLISPLEIPVLKWVILCPRWNWGWRLIIVVYLIVLCQVPSYIQFKLVGYVGKPLGLLSHLL